jgi:hypothetical protein
MTLAQTGYVPSVPEEYIGSLVDTGRWRDRGVTHWHLCQSEDDVNDTRRFSASYSAGQVHRGQSAHDPHEALLWVYAQKIKGLRGGSHPVRYAEQRGWRSVDDLHRSIDVSWDFMTDRCGLLTPIGGGVEVRAGRSLDIYAYPMTVDSCERH